jgi:maltose O-acetyltransferase
MGNFKAMDGIIYFKRGTIDSLWYLRRKLVLFFCNALFFSPSFRPAQDLKIILLKSVIKKIGRGVEFSEALFLLYGRNVSIGDNSKIGTHCKIYDFSSIEIGDNLLASHGLTLISATHDPITYANRSGPITIGDNVWIGINVTIVGPVKIGNNTVIGAGALVIRDVPDNAIVAGVPARLIRYK